MQTKPIQKTLRCNPSLERQNRAIEEIDCEEKWKGAKYG